jgi:hypothetical protein
MEGGGNAVSFGGLGMEAEAELHVLREEVVRLRSENAAIPSLEAEVLLCYSVSISIVIMVYLNLKKLDYMNEMTQGLYTFFFFSTFVCVLFLFVSFLSNHPTFFFLCVRWRR